MQTTYWNTKDQQVLNQPDKQSPPSPPEAAALQPDPPPRALETSPQPARRLRGFAAMDRTLVRELARKGGQAAHAAGTAHQFTSEEARDAGRKGGQATHAGRGQSQKRP